MKGVGATSSLHSFGVTTGLQPVSFSAICFIRYMALILDVLMPPSDQVRVDEFYSRATLKQVEEERQKEKEQRKLEEERKTAGKDGTAGGQRDRDRGRR